MVIRLNEDGKIHLRGIDEIVAKHWCAYLKCNMTDLSEKLMELLVKGVTITKP